MKVLRRFLVIFGSLVVLLVILASLAGYPPGYLIAAPGVGTGIGAKLLCSARYVSGFDRDQAFDDLVQYSPILTNLSISYDENRKTVTTSLFGFSETTASYLPGLGCAIDYAGFDARAAGMTPPQTAAGADWPAGSRVNAPRQDIQQLLESEIAEDNAAGLNTRALLIARHGSIVAESYAQGVDSTTPLLGWSMSKSLSSIMLGNLAYRGLLDLTATPGFPEWAADGRAAISIRNLLNMTDGLDFSERYDPGDDSTAMLFTVPSASAYVLKKPLAHPPGTWFNYSSGTASLLSLIYFNSTGGTLSASYRDFMDNIYRPMGFQNAVFEVDASGVFMGSSYFYASARDWARIGQLMLDDGVINDQRLVSGSWVREATTPNSSENEKAYGFQWWLNRGDARLRWPDLPEQAFAAQGNRQQWVMVIPSQDTVIVRLGWTAGYYPVNRQFARILDAL
ncbi:MAG: serine hydrolase [Gammaproteobacteria bacterium]|nr:serine hydrolase [Pseudomonadales bacterium]MCP5348095.1 serine hydrolase [Pseudomonadales bacterium]